MAAIVCPLKKELDLRDVECKDDTYDIVGMTLKRDRKNRSATLHQTAGIDALLEKAQMTNCNGETTPLAAKTVFTRADCPPDECKEQFKEEATNYRSLTASGLYFSRWTRPDISLAISKLSKFMSNPGQKHFAILKRVLRYLKASRNRCLKYDFSTPTPRKGVYGHYDASHADDVDTLRTTMAYIFFYEGCPISWKTKLHSYVTLSTNNSEYCASAKAAREAKWLHKIFTALGLKDAVSPIDLFSDSTGAIAMNHNPVQHEANKHCDLADHFAREQVERGIITISYVNTKDMIADVLTKALPPASFLKLIMEFMFDS